MKTLLRIAAAMTVCLIPFSAVRAESDAATKALARAAIDEQQLSSAPARMALVQAAAAYCEDLGRVYPHNSPREDEWLNSEVAAGGDRPMNAARSAEFGRRMAANFVNSCAQAANAYQSGRDKRGALLALALTFERYRNEAKYYGDKNGISSDNFGLDAVPGITVEALLVAALAE